jgi:predicted metal-dependent peptidase
VTRADGTVVGVDDRVLNATDKGDAARALAGARAALVLGRDAKSAFFATLALRLTPVPDRSVGTMATDGTRLLYDPAFVLGLAKAERVGVLAHEVMHCALAHFSRRAGRDPLRWNVACDLAVNLLLIHSGFTLPPGRLVPGAGPYASLPPGLAAEDYYARLPAPAGGEEPGPSSSSSKEVVTDPGGCGGVVDPTGGSPAAARWSEAQWTVAVAQAEATARGRGDLPHGLARAVRAIVHPPADWRTVLREFVSSHAKNDYSWSRPNRRYLHHGLYLPGLHSDDLGDVVVAVDTSGSVGTRELGLFAAEVDALLGAFDCTATVLCHDARIQSVRTWTPADGPLTLDPIGGGGTSHVCVFEWVDQLGIDPACVVCLTDMESRFPARPPAVPVLWAKVGDAAVDPPFGRVVPIGH